MAVLIFLARSAGARIIAPDLLPRAHERRRDRDGDRRVAAVAIVGERLLVVGVLVLDVADRGPRLDRLHVFLRTYLDGEHDADDVLLAAGADRVVPGLADVPDLVVRTR